MWLTNKYFRSDCITEISFRLKVINISLFKIINLEKLVKYIDIEIKTDFRQKLHLD